MIVFDLAGWLLFDGYPGLDRSLGPSYTLEGPGPCSLHLGQIDRTRLERESDPFAAMDACPSLALDALHWSYPLHPDPDDFSYGWLTLTTSWSGEYLLPDEEETAIPPDGHHLLHAGSVTWRLPREVAAALHGWMTGSPFPTREMRSDLPS